MDRNKSNKIVFLYPTYDPDNPNPDFASDKMKKQPIGVFTLASYIKHIGYDVELLDSRRYYKEEIRQMIIDECKDAFAVGLSVMTCQITQSYRFSKELKEIYPDLHIIWGGIHSTLFPEQCIRPDFIDFVVNGEGEYCFEKCTPNKNHPDVVITTKYSPNWSFLQILVDIHTRG